MLEHVLNVKKKYRKDKCQMSQTIPPQDSKSTLISSRWIYLFGNVLLIIMALTILVLIMTLRSEAGRNQLKVLGIATEECKKYYQSTESTPSATEVTPSSYVRLSPTQQQQPLDKLNCIQDCTSEISPQPSQSLEQ